MNKDYFNARELILGCGNILFGDDGFGCVVASSLLESDALPDSSYAMDVGTAGAYMLNMLQAAEVHPPSLIIVDSGDFDGSVGTVNKFSMPDINALERPVSLHSFSLCNEAAYYDGTVSLVICQTENISTEPLTVGLSPKIENAVPTACNMVLDIIGGIL